MLERRLLNSKALLGGSFFEQYRKCGKAGCKCERGERHGPYPYLAVGKGAMRRLTYVKDEDVADIKKRDENSKAFDSTLADLSRLNSDIALVLSDLRQALVES